MTKDEAIKRALEALETRCGTNAEERGPSGAITALREALAQERSSDEQPAQQEPFGYVYEVFCLPECATEREWVQAFTTYTPEPDSDICNVVAVYTSPPVEAAPLAQCQRSVKPLPQSEWPKKPSPYVNDQYRGYLGSDLDDYAMQVLAAHGIKENT